MNVCVNKTKTITILPFILIRSTNILHHHHHHHLHHHQPPPNTQDLESKAIVDELRAEPLGPKSVTPNVISLAWSADGTTLFAGYTDNAIRVWVVA